MKKNDSQPLVSIIVPVYNVEDYLEECVKSIMAQSYKNLEIIIVDDGSTDGCPAMCDSLKKGDKRISVIHKQNGGLSDARNVGIDAASGKYICFVDSDDYIHSKYVEKLLTAVLESGADMSVCGFTNIELDGSRKIEEKPEKAILDADGYWETLFSRMRITFVVAWDKLYKKELFKKLRFAEGKINEDEIILLDLVNSCKKISIVGDSLYYYRERPDSIMGKKDKAMSGDAYESLLIRADYFLGRKRYDLCVAQVKQLLGGTYGGKQAKKYSKRMMKIIRRVPKKYKDKKFRFKLFVFRYLPCLYGLKRLRKA